SLIFISSYWRRRPLLHSQNVPSFTVRVGDDVTLPCGRVTEDQPNCDQITWLFSRDIGKAAVELVTNGDLSKNAKAKAERLNVSEDCSLVIKNVTPQDVGLYTCRQFRSGEQHGPDAKVSLSCTNSVPTLKPFLMRTNVCQTAKDITLPLVSIQRHEPEASHPCWAMIFYVYYTVKTLTFCALRVFLLIFDVRSGRVTAALFSRVQERITR
uniref:Ig-like domain-containing protein n=1 Tax=Labrus bergylta TaxID=56723 RepID=A0A3Q3EL73_9LABR